MGIAFVTKCVVKIYLFKVNCISFLTVRAVLNTSYIFLDLRFKLDVYAKGRAKVLKEMEKQMLESITNDQLLHQVYQLRCSLTTKKAKVYLVSVLIIVHLVLCQ